MQEQNNWSVRNPNFGRLPQPGTTPIKPPLQSVFVIVPCFNEGPVIRQTIAELLPLGVTVVVVDDGSRLPVRQPGEPLPFHLVRHSINLGQGAALQTGMDYALRQGAELLIHFDADGQHDPSTIPPMVEILRSQSTDVVFGSRFLLPARKRLLLRVSTFISRLFCGLWLSDTRSGLRGLTRQAAQQIRLTENGSGHASEILSEIRRARLRYVEIPTLVRSTDYSRGKGQSIGNSLNLAFDPAPQKTKFQLLLIASIVSGALIASATLAAKLGNRFALPQRNNDSIGRGADLLLYLSIIVGTYALLLNFQRTRRLEQRLTQHVRAAALQSAIPPEHFS